MKNRTDLILGEAFCIFIFFYFLDSGLSVLNSLQFYFRLRDSENREYRIRSFSLIQNIMGPIKDNHYFKTELNFSSDYNFIYGKQIRGRPYTS